MGNVRIRQLASSRVQFSTDIEVVEVEKRIEDQEIAADGLTTPHRIVGEEYDVTPAQRDIDNYRPLRDVAAIEQSRRQQLTLVGEAQHHTRPKRGWYYRQRVPQLFVGDRRCLPWLDGPAPRDVVLRVERDPALRHVELLGGATSSRARIR